MAKIQQPPQPRASWPWPKDVRQRLVTKGQLEAPKARRQGDPKDPPLASASLLESLKTDGGVTATRLSPPPTPEAMLAAAETQARAERRSHVRRAMSKAARSKSSLAQLVTAGALARLPDQRRSEVREQLEREEAMLKLLEGLSSELDEIARKQQGEEKS